MAGNLPVRMIEEQRARLIVDGEFWSQFAADKAEFDAFLADPEARQAALANTISAEELRERIYDQHPDWARPYRLPSHLKYVGDDRRGWRK